MKKSTRTRERLITACLEGISKRVFSSYSPQITQLAGEKPGIYALYKRNKLYYVGLATDLKRRIKHHLADQHGRNWDTFSLYLVHREAHLKDLEAMSIRIAKPKGNDIKGGRLVSLRPELKALIDDFHTRQTSRILGLSPDSARKVRSARPQRRVPLEERRFDTIVCPAHEEGFKEVFLGENMWRAIRISDKVIPRLKYIAIYVTDDVKAITHYGRVKAIKPWKRTGKLAVYLKGKAIPIGPIPWGNWVAIQGPRLTTFRKLKKASTLAGAF